MQRIFKYALKLEARQKITAPSIKPLCVQVQNKKHYLWAIVDAEKEDTTIEIFCESTGNAFDKGEKKYLSTTQDLIYVWHWFYTAEFVLHPERRKQAPGNVGCLEVEKEFGLPPGYLNDFSTQSVKVGYDKGAKDGDFTAKTVLTNVYDGKKLEELKERIMFAIKKR